MYPSDIENLIKRYIGELACLQIACLHPYHPWYKGTNPQFSENDSRILALKRCQDGAVQHFALELKENLSDQTAPIICIPPSDPNGSSGIRKTARLLANYGWADWSSVLHRTQKLSKKSLGGARNLANEISSLQVSHRIPCKRVILLDDITTSGTSMKAGYILLREAGAEEVFCQAIGRTV